LTSYEEVKRRFEKYGRVKAIRLKTGFGFVDYEDPRAANNAARSMNGKKIFGNQRLLVETTRKAYD